MTDANLYLPHMCFTAGYPPDEAEAAFIEKYGREPAYAVIDNGVLWVGPVPQVYEAPETSATQRKAWLRSKR